MSGRIETMRRVSWLWLLVALLATAPTQQAPLMLVYQERVPTENPENDPNLPIQTSLTQFLKEIRKVRIEWYRPDHPIAQQVFAQHNLASSQREQPNRTLLSQVARAMQATYLLTVRCTNGKQGHIEYACTLWQLGRRQPIWQSEGIQQVTPETSKNALQSLLRTLVMRMDQEVFQSLPTLPETPPPPVANPSAPSVRPKDDPRSQIESLLREGQVQEVVAPLRTLVTREPMNLNYRLQLIQVYRQLGMQAHAYQAVDNALRLFPEEETLLTLWATLLRAQRPLDEAIPALQQQVQAHPTVSALRLSLFDMLLEAGRFAEAQAALEPLHPTSSPEIRWRLYLLEGATRHYRSTGDPVQAESEQASLWWRIVSGAFTDLANEILDLRRLAKDPAPSWKQLRERSEALVQQVLAFGQWVGRMQPDTALQKSYQHLRFGCQLLGQSAQLMARFLLSKNNEEAERAAILRIEALRELESAQPK